MKKEESLTGGDQDGKVKGYGVHISAGWGFAGSGRKTGETWALLMRSACPQACP